MQIEQEVSAPQKAILKSTASINLFLAGLGSGKSHLSGIKLYQLIRTFPDAVGFVGANFYDQLNTATLFRIREYWKSVGIIEYSKDSSPWGQYVIGKTPPEHFKKHGHNFESYHNIISFINGAIIFIGSMDNAKNHEGKEISYAFLDETKDTDETDVKEIIMGRLRKKGMYLVNGQLSHTGKPDQQYNPLFITTSPAKTEWISKWFNLENYVEEINSKIYSRETFFEKRVGDKFAVISSTYHNVKNVGENYIQSILDNNSEERGRALVFGNPFTQTGGEFYSSFDRLKHVGKCTYDKTKPLHISFDQNSVPYNSCSIWQFERKDDIWWSYCIDEIALENPRNSTEEVCEEILMRYNAHKSAIYYYGDASGRARSTMNKEFKHHYEIIEYKLRRFLTNGSARMMRQNPSITKRRDFINRIFEEKLPIRILIDESCKLMVADMMYVKQDINGAKDKHIVTDKETGDRYQKYGHLSDTCFVGETIIITDKGNKAISKIKVGDNVLTRKGFKKVIDKRKFYNKEVKKYSVGDRNLSCTPDHKIYASGQFIMVSSLTAKNIISIFAIKKTWIEKLLLLMGINFTDTLMQTDQVIGTISKDGQKKQGYGKRFISISTYGKSITGKFKRDLRYITLMVILAIIKLKISILLLIKSIWVAITNVSLMLISRCLKMYCKKRPNLKHQNGINHLTEERGILRMLNTLYMVKSILRFAKNAKPFSKQNLEGDQNTAVLVARIGELHDWLVLQQSIMKIGYVPYAETRLDQIDGAKLLSALVNVREKPGGQKTVYDITVEDEHEYFANGILVHNCEYQLCEVFNSYYK